MKSPFLIGDEKAEEKIQAELGLPRTKEFVYPIEKTKGFLPLEYYFLSLQDDVNLSKLFKLKKFDL